MVIAMLTNRKHDSSNDNRLGEKAYRAVKEGILTNERGSERISEPRWQVGRMRAGGGVFPPA